MTYCVKCNEPILLASCNGKCLDCWSTDNLAAVNRIEAAELKRCAERVCKLVQEQLQDQGEPAVVQKELL